MIINEKHIKKTFVRQQDQSDCGVACLLAIIKYYEGVHTIESLRSLSGTNQTGTTMLGLYQAAQNSGFNTDGCEINVELLSQYHAPCILYIHTNHYVIYFGKMNEAFMIGDPAKGIEYWDKKKLNEVWETKRCLMLIPNEQFKKVDEIKLQKWKWIVSLIKPDMPLLVIAAGLGVAITTLGLVMAIFSQRLIDDILPTKNFTKLNWGIVLVLLLLLIKEGLSYLRQYFLFRQLKDFNNRIIDFFYTRLLKLPKPFFDTRKIGELTARLNDTARIQKVISQLAGNIVIDALIAIVAVIFIFSYSWQVGIICLIFMPLFFILIYYYNKKILNGQRDIMKSYAQTESNYISTLQGIEQIKNYNRQDLFLQRNQVIYNNYQANIFSLGKIQISLSCVANTFAVIFLISILTFSSYQVLHYHLKTGELIAILSMANSLLPSVANLGLVSIPINEAKIAFDRMFEFTASQPEKDVDDPIVANEFRKLEVQHLSFRFAGRKRLLMDVSFQVSKGEIIAVMGENGCGKSTLTQILQRHYLPEEGNIYLNDCKLSEIELKSWRNICSGVPQHIHIFNSTVLENIAYEDAVNHPQKVILFLEQHGFLPLLESLPQSVMTLVGEEGINLSGGQKQIIALARALYNNPQLLILDEATSAMDRDTELFVLNLLKNLKHKMGVIFITHRLHVLKNFCDRIYILEDGTITASGNHAHLLQTNNLYSKYWLDLA